MRQMVEEINLGRLTIDQAMANFNLLTRHTVRNRTADAVAGSSMPRELPAR
jgi:hypothetical protein